MLKRTEKKQIQSYKHNGKLHRVWQTVTIIFEDKEVIIAGNIRTRVTEKDGRNWYSKEPAVVIFYKHKWFNVIAMKRETGIYYYVNMSSPVLYDEEAIKYIDYDLDLKIIDGNVVILDEEEYLENSVLMEYPDKLKRILKKELHEVSILMQQKQIPFNDAYINEKYQELLEIEKGE